MMFKFEDICRCLNECEYRFAESLLCSEVQLKMACVLSHTRHDKFYAYPSITTFMSISCKPGVSTFHTFSCFATCVCTFICVCLLYNRRVVEATTHGSQAESQ